MDLLIYGASGFGREVASWAERATTGGTAVRVVGHIDDLTPGRSVNGRPVFSLEDAVRLHEGASFVVAVGDPELRRLLVDKAEAAGIRASAPLIHPSVEFDREFVTIGSGSVICGGTTLTTNTTVGRHVQINLHCTVAHDVVLEDFATLSPGVHVSGTVIVRRGAYFGTGAVTINGAPGHPLTVGEGSVVGAGTVVMKDVPGGVTVFGVPARAFPVARPSG